MNRSSLLAATLLLGLAIPATSHANIVRGCRAQLMISVPGQQFAHTIDAFEGRGDCRSKAKANSCRERAKNAIFGCAKDYWVQRGAAVLPIKCKPGRGNLGVNGLGPFKANKRNGSRYDLRFAIEYEACCKVMPRADQLTLDVMVVSLGDKGCGKNKNPYYYGDKSSRVSEAYVMHRGFKANCKRLRAQGWCS